MSFVGRCPSVTRSALGGSVANFLDDDLITLLCDHCGDETQVKVRILRQNQTVACLACGMSLEYTAAEFRQESERGTTMSAGDITQHARPR